MAMPTPNDDKMGASQGNAGNPFASFASEKISEFKFSGSTFTPSNNVTPMPQ
jgi:hypothetical protein